VNPELSTNLCREKREEEKEEIKGATTCRGQGRHDQVGRESRPVDEQADGRVRILTSFLNDIAEKSWSHVARYQRGPTKGNRVERAQKKKLQHGLKAGRGLISSGKGELPGKKKRSEVRHR